jgi:hypothetical protein
MIAYLVQDGILPVYKIGHATRFDPTECDIAMSVFRKASLYDDLIKEELGNQRDSSAAKNASDKPAGDYADISHSKVSKVHKTTVHTSRKRPRRRSAENRRGHNLLGGKVIGFGALVPTPRPNTPLYSRGLRLMRPPENWRKREICRLSE